MSGTTIFLRTPTLKLTIGQRNGLKSFMKETNDKKEYRRAQAVLEKSEGKTHKAIAKEHGVDERTTQRWIAAYIKKGIEGLQICRNSRSKSSITDEDKEIILSALFNDPHLFGYLRSILESRKGVYFDGSNTTNRILDVLEEKRWLLVMLSPSTYPGTRYAYQKYSLIGQRVSSCSSKEEEY